MADKVRLDTLLVDRDLFESRTKAAAAIMAGDVLVGVGRRRATKPGALVAPDSVLDVKAAIRYASRGGFKLQNAFQAFSLDPESRSCLDVGASTGGFTDYLLQHGAEHVVALDVAYGELHWRLREDKKVSVVERTNARTITAEDLPYGPDLITVDLSFISLRKVLPVVLPLAAERFECVALVKPQFELGREKVGKNGVVRESELRIEAMVLVGQQAQELGFVVAGFCPSGVKGPAGNKESFILIKNGEGGGVSIAEAAENCEKEWQRLEQSDQHS